MRQRIGALIVQTIVPSRMPLPVVTFSPEIEVLLNQSVRANPGAEWPFEHGMAMKIIEQVGQAAVEPLLLQTRSFALVASPLCRSRCRGWCAPYPRRRRDLLPEIPANKQTEIVATIGAEMPRLATGSDAHMEDQPHEKLSPPSSFPHRHPAPPVRGYGENVEALVEEYAPLVRKIAWQVFSRV